MSFTLKKALVICLLVFIQANTAYARKNIYFPSGIKLGSFSISPLFESENEYDSNIFKTTNNENDDFIFHLKPSVNLRSNWSRHALDLTVRADVGLYNDFDSEDFEDVFIDLSGRLDVLRDSFATSKFYWSQQHEDRGDIDNGGIDGPTEFMTIGGIFQYEHLFNRLRLNLDNDVNYLDYDGRSVYADEVAPGDPPPPPVENDLRNRFSNTTSAQLSYELNPRLDFFIRGEYNFIDYDSNVDRSGFNRDSDGFEIHVGSGLDFTGKLFGDVYIGYREQYYDDNNLDDIDGITGGVALRWNATALTTVSLAVDNDILQTTQNGASGGLSTAFKLNVDHELLRYVLLNAHGGYTVNDYEGSSSPNPNTPGSTGTTSREDDILLLGVQAKYLYSRNFYLKGEYSFRQRESNIPLNDYDAHRVLLSIGLQI